RNAAPSASRAAAHSAPTRWQRRCRWAGLMRRLANSRRSSLAEAKGALAAWRTASRTAWGLKPSQVRPSRSSRGKKDHPAGRAAVLGAAELDVAGGGGQDAARRRWLGGAEQPPGPAAAGAARGVVGARGGEGVGVEALLQQPAGEVAGEVR